AGVMVVHRSDGSGDRDGGVNHQGFAYAQIAYGCGKQGAANALLIFIGVFEFADVHGGLPETSEMLSFRVPRLGADATRKSVIERDCAENACNSDGFADNGKWLDLPLDSLTARKSHGQAQVAGRSALRYDARPSGRFFCAARGTFARRAKRRQAVLQLP